MQDDAVVSPAFNPRTRMHGDFARTAQETMEQKTKDLRQTLISQPHLLRFESQREYQQLADAIRDHISPQDVLEGMWTSEIIEAEWEIARLRRYKGKIVSLDTLVSLRNLLQSILPDHSDAEIDDLARRSYTNKEIRNQVDKLLRSIDLDESAIVVEAYRSAIPHLTAIDRRLMELALRRDKIFR